MATAEIMNPDGSDWSPSADWAQNGFVVRDGFDLAWKQSYLQDQMASIEDDIRAIELNANLSDTEKMFAMQMAMNTWQIIANLRTSEIKMIADVCKLCVRNMAS